MSVENKRAFEAVTMPQLGESIVEATLVRWLVTPGTIVARGQAIAAIETDKASSEIPAPSAGVLEACIPEGTTVAVGHTIAMIRVGPATPSATPGPQRVGPPRLSPAVRRIARQSGLDPNALQGTGRHGRVTRDDMLRAIEASLARARPGPALSSTVSPATSPTPAHAFVAQPAESRPVGSTASTAASLSPESSIPSASGQTTNLSKRRRAIARELRKSLETAVHVFAVTEIDMSRVENARATDREMAEKQGLRLTYLPYVVSATAAALRAFPDLNASIDGDRVTHHNEVNIGIATETPLGLVVPVVRAADDLGIIGLARALERLSTGARAATLAPQDITGGTFTVSNPGRDGNLYGVSIIRQPEVGILRMGTVQKRAVVEEVGGQDAIFVRPMMYAALSYDHRVVDGRSGNAFLSRIKEHLERTQPLSV